LAIAYKVYRCWVSEFTMASDFDANGESVAIETIQFQNEGFERDLSVTEPTEPSFATT
jgi:phage tail-like protein